MCSGDLDGAPSFVAVVNPAKRLEVGRVEALDTERETVHSGAAEGGEFLRLDRSGVGFQRDFGVGQHRQQRTDGGEQAIKRRPGEQAWRTATKEDARYLSPPDQRQGGFEVGNQRADILVFRNAVRRLVRIEVAIGALLHAPRDMDVERERRRMAKFEPAFRLACGLALRDDRDDA